MVCICMLMAYLLLWLRSKHRSLDLRQGVVVRGVVGRGFRFRFTRFTRFISCHKLCRYNNEQTTNQTKAINNSYTYIMKMWHKPCRTFHPWCPCIKTRCLWYLLSIHTCDGMLLCDRPNLLYSIAIAQYMYRTKPYYTCTLFCLTFLCWGYITVFLYNYKYFLSAFLRVISLTLTQVWIYEFSPETITRSVWFKYNDVVTYTNVSNIIKKNLMGHALFIPHQHVCRFQAFSCQVNEISPHKCNII